MLDVDQVYNLFLLFTDLSGDGGEGWKGFCRSAIHRVQARLRPGVDPTLPEHRELLQSAAAAWAYCDYLLVATAAGSSDEVRVGDIALKTTASATSDKADAVEIRDYFLAQAAHLLTLPCPVLMAAGAP